VQREEENNEKKIILCKKSYNSIQFRRELGRKGVERSNVRRKVIRIDNGRMNALEKIFVSGKYRWMCEVKFNYCKPSPLLLLCMLNEINSILFIQFHLKK